MTRDYIKLAALLLACVALAPVLMLLIAVFPAVFPAEFENAKNGGF